jgi:hypothetical protein
MTHDQDRELSAVPVVLYLLTQPARPVPTLAEERESRRRIPLADWLRGAEGVPV